MKCIDLGAGCTLDKGGGSGFIHHEAHWTYKHSAAVKFTLRYQVSFSVGSPLFLETEMSLGDSKSNANSRRDRAVWGISYYWGVKHVQTFFHAEYVTHLLRPCTLRSPRCATSRPFCGRSLWQRILWLTLCGYARSYPVQVPMLR